MCASDQGAWGRGVSAGFVQCQVLHLRGVGLLVQGQIQGPAKERKHQFRKRLTLEGQQGLVL